PEGPAARSLLSTRGDGEGGRGDAGASPPRGVRMMALLLDVGRVVEELLAVGGLLDDHPGDVEDAVGEGEVLTQRAGPRLGRDLVERLLDVLAVGAVGPLERPGEEPGRVVAVRGVEHGV